MSENDYPKTAPVEAPPPEPTRMESLAENKTLTELAQSESEAKPEAKESTDGQDKGLMEKLSGYAQIGMVLLATMGSPEMPGQDQGSFLENQTQEQSIQELKENVIGGEQELTEAQSRNEEAKQLGQDLYEDTLTPQEVAPPNDTDPKK